MLMFSSSLQTKRGNCVNPVSAVDSGWIVLSGDRQKPFEARVVKDSGWPGHRRLSFLVYLQAPIKGGETCLLRPGEKD